MHNVSSLPYRLTKSALVRIVQSERSSTKLTNIPHGYLAVDPWSPRQAEEKLKRLLGLFGDLRGTKAPLRYKPPLSKEGRRMRSHIQFITTPTVDTPGTGLLLHFDNKRYFFGQMHEGIQRASLQHGSKLLKMREIFLTGKTDIQTTGGLLGMVLTVADSATSSVLSAKAAQKEKREAALRRAEEEEKKLVGKGKSSSNKKAKPIKEVPPLLDIEPEPLTIHGAPNILHFIAAARAFIFRQGLPLSVDEYVEGTERTGPESKWKPTWEDENIKVWAMPIVPVSEDGVDSAELAGANEEQGLLRKRSHEDYVRGQQGDSSLSKGLRTDTGSGQEDLARQLRENVVHEMFSSAWRLDNFVEMKLADVKLPAKMFIRDPETKHLKPYNGPLPNGQNSVPNVDVLVRPAWPGALIHRLPPNRRSTTALSYVVRNQAQRGKFMVQKAKDLRVPEGRLFSELARGGSVTLRDGRVVTADQVLEPGKVGGGVAIVDLPTRGYITPLLHREEWSQEIVMQGVGAFIWILGPGVAQDERLSAFMKQFDRFQHIISSSDICSNQLVMASAASASVRHHLIDPERYSLLQHHNTHTSIDSGSVNSSSRVVAVPGLMLQLEPRVEVENKEVHHPVNLVEIVKEIPATVIPLAKQATRTIRAESAQAPLEDQKLPSPDAEIVCLGTGSALPSLYRNVSGTLLRVPGRGSYLFDAGENTLGQLKRIYSPKEFSEVLRDLKMIWISHLHADHHLGTAAIIKAWYTEVHGTNTSKRPIPSSMNVASKSSEILREGQRLFVVSSSQMMRWLYEYSSVEDYGYDQLVPLEASIAKTDLKAQEKTHLLWNTLDVGFKTTSDLSVKSALQAATGLEDLSACFVAHCHDAMAVSITFADGFKFSYSGDCRPSRNFAAIGKGSTVLVHEATFDDELHGDAIAKKHSTISEAAGVGVQMGARRVILTHFSQRYQKIPTMSDLDGNTVRLETAGAGGEDSDGDQMEPLEAPDALTNDSGPSVRAHQNNPISQHTTTAVQIRQNEDMKIAVAFDYMRVKVKDIASLEHFVPALRELYKTDGSKVAVEEKKPETVEKKPLREWKRLSETGERG